MLLVFVLGVILLLFAIGALAMALSVERAPTGVGRSIAVLEQMSAAPTALLEEATERAFGERVLDPLRRRTVRLGRRLTGADSSDRLRRKLDVAGNPRDWTADRVVSVKVIGAAALLVVGIALGVVVTSSASIVVLCGVGGLALGFFLPDVYLYQAAYNRSEQLGIGLPDAIDLLTISVEAGLGFDAACQQVARHTTGPLAEEFARMLAEMQIGQGRSAALRGMAERTNVPELRSFVGAMVQADAFGIPVGQVLRVQAAEIRVKRRQHAEAKAQQVPVKITIPLIFCILPCLFVAVLGPAALVIMDNFG